MEVGVVVTDVVGGVNESQGIKGGGVLITEDCVVKEGTVVVTKKGVVKSGAVMTRDVNEEEAVLAFPFLLIFLRTLVGVVMTGSVVVVVRPGAVVVVVVVVVRPGAVLFILSFTTLILLTTPVRSLRSSAESSSHSIPPDILPRITFL